MLRNAGDTNRPRSYHVPNSVIPTQASMNLISTASGTHPISPFLSSNFNSFLMPHLIILVSQSVFTDKVGGDEERTCEGF